MVCKQLDKCPFYGRKTFELSDKQFEFFVHTFCIGDFQHMCMRQKWREEFGEDPPDELCPDGYSAITKEKIYH